MNQTTTTEGPLQHKLRPGITLYRVLPDKVMLHVAGRLTSIAGEVDEFIELMRVYSRNEDGIHSEDAFGKAFQALANREAQDASQQRMQEAYSFMLHENLIIEKRRSSEMMQNEDKPYATIIYGQEGAFLNDMLKSTLSGLVRDVSAVHVDELKLNDGPAMEPDPRRFYIATGLSTYQLYQLNKVLVAQRLPWIFVSFDGGKMVVSSLIVPGKACFACLRLRQLGTLHSIEANASLEHYLESRPADISTAQSIPRWAECMSAAMVSRSVAANGRYMQHFAVLDIATGEVQCLEISRLTDCDICGEIEA